MGDYMLKTTPAVFAVGSEYQICVKTNREAMLWVWIDNQEFYDESNGIMRSLDELHRICVPMDLLDNAGRYTVFVRPIIERKPSLLLPVKQDIVFRVLFGHNVFTNTVSI